MKSNFLALLISFAFVFLGQSSSSAQVTLLDRISFVTVADFGTGETDSTSTTDFALFSESVSIRDIAATQSSSVTDSIFDIDIFAIGGTSADADDIAEAFSAFEVDFQVQTNIPFFLVGELNGVIAEISLETAAGSQLLHLTTLSGSPIDASWSTELTPGDYTFSVHAQEIGSSFTPGTGVDISVMATFFEPVPEPSSVVLCIGLGLLIGSRRWITKR